MKTFVITLLLMVSGVSGIAQSATQTLTFTSQRSLMLVKVLVDGHELTLIYDTGAERTLINSPKESVERTTSLAIGSRSLRLPLAFVDLRGTDMAKVGADGVLGQDVLRKFNHVSFDYANKTITLE